jgi:hypothetical protein
VYGRAGPAARTCEAAAQQLLLFIFFQ